MQRQVPVVLILGTMGTRLVTTGSRRSTVWIPTRPWSIVKELDRLRCDEDGKPLFPVETNGCLERWPWDFVSPLRQELSRHGLALDVFPYDWRQSFFRAAESLRDWIDARGFRTCNIIGVSTGGLIATQYVRSGFASRVRKFVSLGTPFLGMPRALASLHTGVGLGPVTDLFLARKVSDLVRTFPSTYELLPCQSYFETEPMPCLSIPTGPVTSSAAMLEWLKNVPRACSSLAIEGSRFLAELDPVSTLRQVDTSFIVNSSRLTPAQVTYHSTDSVRVTSHVFGDGAVPVASQTIGHQTDAVNPGRTFLFEARHRTMHLKKDVMRRMVEILTDTVRDPDSSHSQDRSGDQQELQ